MAGRKPLNPPRHKHGFVKIEYVRCPDCEIGDATSRLRNDGGAVVVGGGQLKGSTREVGITRASSGCPTCKGRGSLSTKDVLGLKAAGIDYPDLAHLDPYALQVSAAIERRKSSAKRGR